MRRPLAVTALALGLLAACSSDLSTPVVEIPDGSDQFSFVPALLGYELVDSTAIQKLKLTWLPSQPFAGSNCLAFSPSPAVATSGSFVFATYGANVGRMRQVIFSPNPDTLTFPNQVDTVLGLFLSGHEGTRGTWTLAPSGALTLNWADADPAQRSYFDAAAAIRIAGDTIFSDIYKSDHNDSAHVEWHVRWLRGIC